MSEEILSPDEITEGQIEMLNLGVALSITAHSLFFVLSGWFAVLSSWALFFVSVKLAFIVSILAMLFITLLWWVAYKKSWKAVQRHE